MSLPLKTHAKEARKEKILLYGEELDTKEIFHYLPEYVTKRMSRRDRELIETALYLTVVSYKNRYEREYLDKMLL